MIEVILPDGSKREYEDGASALDVAESISKSLAKKALAAKVNGELRDITLFHELLNKQGAPFHFTFGDMIEPSNLAGPGTEVTEALKQYVSYTLQDNPAAVFQPVGTPG